MRGEGVQWRPGFLPDHRHASAWTTGAWLLALTIPLSETVWRNGARQAAIVVVSLAVAMFWEIVFAKTLRRRIDAHFLVAALVFAALAPPAAPYWQLALGSSFALIVGVHIFGGHGWTFLNHSVVAFAFLLFAFPSGAYGSIAFPSWFSVAPGALLLVALGVVAWQTAVAVLLFFALILLAIAGPGAAPVALAPAMLFPVVFLACDPVASPSQSLARAAYGLVVGGLTAVLSLSGKSLAEAAFSALLLGALFAPLLDHATVRLHIWRREARNG